MVYWSVSQSLDCPSNLGPGAWPGGGSSPQCGLRGCKSPKASVGCKKRNYIIYKILCVSATAADPGGPGAAGAGAAEAAGGHQAGAGQAGGGEAEAGAATAPAPGAVPETGKAPSHRRRMGTEAKAKGRRVCLGGQNLFNSLSS